MRQAATFVLVHGAWGGAWVWRRVLGPLRAAGHEVHAVTLTGDGERAHLRHAGIGLATHVADVTGLVAAEELDDIVLVGHSYGGIVITQAADVLLGRAVKLRALVYVDAMVPHSGESWSSHHPADVKAMRLAAAAQHDNALPPPDAASFGVAEADAAWLARRHVPHPFGMYQEAVVFDAARLARLSRWFVDCNSPAYPTVAPIRQRVRQEPNWQVRVIPTGHFPMLTEPATLVALLREAAA